MYSQNLHIYVQLILDRSSILIRSDRTYMVGPYEYTCTVQILIWSWTYICIGLGFSEKGQVTHFTNNVCDVSISSAYMLRDMKKKKQTYFRQSNVLELIVLICLCNVKNSFSHLLILKCVYVVEKMLLFKFVCQFLNG